MMVIDRLLAERAAQGNPVRVAMAGCGFMGRGLVNQIVNSVPGVALAAIAVRSPDIPSPPSVVSEGSLPERSACAGRPTMLIKRFGPDFAFRRIEV
jgi:predicted homoserine dehydrogenase-like protein